MVAINLDQVHELADTLLTHRFTVEIPDINDADKLTIQCQQMVFPGSAINPVETILHGFKRIEMGRKEHPGTMAATFVETRDMTVWKALKGWQEECRGTQSGASSGKRSDLVKTVTITVFDEQNEEVGVAKTFGTWPQDIPEVQLDGSGDQQFLITATLSYDYVEYDNVDMK